MLASRERRDTSVAFTSTLHWFETDVLAEERNYHGLTRLNTDLVQRAAARPHSRRVTLDIDSSESPVHGTQEQSAYNGHFESVFVLQLAEGYLTKHLLRQILGHVERLAWHPT